MWQTNWRDDVWARLSQLWDLIVVGGGITGAGILRQATHLGLKALLVEKKDFAWGTSSRSTKLIHGGLRYLAQGQYSVTRESVREREWLMKEGPGLVDPLGFLFATYKDGSPSKWKSALGLAVYDLYGRKWDHRYYKGDDFLMLAPHINGEGLRGGFRYFDAVTDDARLVLRIIREAVRVGGTALNYAAVEELLFDRHGQVNGVLLRNQETGRTAELHTRVVINASGAWTDELRKQVGGQGRIRPSRGSHLLFPAWRFPVAQAITLVHPQDGRPVFVLPWEGVTLAGTTDLDHSQPLAEEPRIEPSEVDYIMAALDHRFPALRLGGKDVLATFAGIRPIIGSGKGDPSKESRTHLVLKENSLITIAGGKLTTFRPMAFDALRAARHMLGRFSPPAHDARMLDPIPPVLPGAELLDADARRRLLGRYGSDAATLVAAAGPGELEIIPNTNSLWAELRWAARDEGVVHLDDLLLRRVRLGLLLPNGGMPIMERIRAIVQPELGWDDARWEAEKATYADLWTRAYSIPPTRA